MGTNRFTTWFLLGYLALLLNVGQSAHHADFFGFHNHCADSTCDTHADWSDFDISGDCCCDHDHSETHSHATGPSEPEAVLRVDTSCGDCLLCQYFDHFYAIDSSTSFDLEESPNCESLNATADTASYRSIECSARGPPAFFLS